MVMWWVVGSVIGVYVSGGVSGLLNMSSLNFVYVARFISVWSSLGCFSIFQNFFGSYFSMFGSSICSLALCRVQLSLKCLYACCVR